MGAVKNSAVLALLLPVVVGVGACSSTSEGEEAEAALESGAKHFDVNDVGGVLGRAGGAMVPSIPIATTMASDGKPLLPASVFQGIKDFGANLSFAGPNGPITGRIDFSGGAENLANWHVTGWRFDPCATNPLDKALHGGHPALSSLAGKSAADAKAMLDSAGCFVQLRLIAQPIVGGRDMDFTMHLVFTLDGGNQLGKRDAIIKDLLDLKAKSPVATTGRPLGVHPALAGSAPNAQFGEALKALLLKHLVSEGATPIKTGLPAPRDVVPVGLTAVAFMGLENARFEPWDFYAGRVSKGTWTAVPIPAFGGEVAAQTFRQISPQGVFPKLPATVPNTASLFDSAATSSDPTAPQPGDIAHAVNNPTRADFFTTDCVSCHTSTQRIVSMKLASTSPERFPTPVGVTGVIAGQDLQGSSWNLRNCGYFNGKVAVSLRTANETAEGVDAINKVLLPAIVAGTKANNPGDNCSSQATFDCFVASRGDASECRSTCAVIDVPDQPPPVDPLAGIPACANRSAAQRDPGLPTGTEPASYRAVGKTQRLGVRLSVSDGACLGRILSGGFQSKQTAPRPNGVSGGPMPVLEIFCSVAERCDAIFNVPVSGPKAVTLDANDSQKLFKLITTSDKAFTTVNNGKSGEGLSVKCSSAQSCTVSPIVK